MNVRRFNWPIWVGFLVSLFGAASYLFIFVRWPITRDFPWVNLLLFAIAAVLVFIGLRRAFASQKGQDPDREGGGRFHSRASKIFSSIGALLTVSIIGFFLFGFFVASTWLPASHGAPQVGRTAPDFNP